LVRFTFGINLHKSESGNQEPRHLTWHITPDVMAITRIHKGSVAGGFNRHRDYARWRYDLPQEGGPSWPQALQAITSSSSSRPGMNLAQPDE